MEENEIISLKNSKMYVARVGRWMNIFSIVSVLGMLFIVAGGIVMLYASNMMDEATPYYLDNVVGLGGVGMIILAGPRRFTLLSTSSAKARNCGIIPPSFLSLYLLLA